MKALGLVIAAVVAVAGAGMVSYAAHAKTTRCDVDVDRVLERVDVEFPEGWTLRWRYDELTPEQQEHYLTETGSRRVGGLADPVTETVQVWPGNNCGDDETLHAVLHEIGHAYDFTVLDEDDRTFWTMARNLDEWDQEDFAEAFAYCQTLDPGLIRDDDVVAPTDIECEIVASFT